MPAKTDTGGEVLAIGQPRMRLANDSVLGGLAIVAKSGIAVVEDARDVLVWDLASGLDVARIAPLPEAAYITTTFAVSPDGNRIATASGDKTRVFARPFANPELTIPCSTVDGFSHDGKLILCHGRLPEIWDVATKRSVAKAPDPSLTRSPRVVAFASDDKSVYWATDHDISRWDVGGGAVANVLKSKDEIQTVVFAGDGNDAFVSTRPDGSYKFSSVVLDLRTGGSTPLTTSYRASVSTDGSRAAFQDLTTLRVVEVHSGKTLWSMPLAARIQRIAFSEDANLFGYVVGGVLNIVDIPKGPRAYDAPTRFVGWVDDGVAAVERAGKVEHLTLADRSRTAGTSLEAAPKLSGAPAWATWIGGDSSAAEPSARHDAKVDARADTPCMAKLRVWTSKGGEKKLSMRCTPNAVDPGWELGGTTAVAVGAKSAAFFDAASGKQVGSVDVDKPWLDKPAFARSFAAMAVSPKGNYVALVSVGPRLPPQGSSDPREDGFHQSESRDKIECEMVMGECVAQYVVTMYSLAASPTKMWQEPIGKPTSLTFDRAGGRLFVGTDDGEIRVFSSDGKGRSHAEKFHRGPIVRVSPAPGDRWVMSEDAAGQQRVWRLP